MYFEYRSGLYIIVFCVLWSLDILVKIDLKFYCEMLGYINLDFGIYNGI